MRKTEEPLVESKELLVDARSTPKRSTDRINFTKASLETRMRDAAEAKQRHTVYDKDPTSLGLLIQPTGTAAYFWFRRQKGKASWKKIAKYTDVSIEQARNKAREYDGLKGTWELQGFKGPAPVSTKSVPLTLGDVLDKYIDTHLKHEAKNPDKAVKLARWQFNRYLSQWENTHLDNISEDEVRELHQKIGSKAGKHGPKTGKEQDVEAHHGRYTANRVIGQVRTLYNWAIKNKKWKGINPAADIERFPEVERKRWVGQSGDEMPRFFKAVLSEKSIDLRDFVLLALFTGARKADILSMRWDQLNLKTKRWSIPDPKNEEPYTVVLVDLVVALLRSRLKLRAEGEEWVFPGVGKLGHMRDVKKAWATLRRNAKLTDVRIHDLRRTLGSWQANEGASQQIIGKSLGHKPGSQATQVYSQLDLKTVEESLDTATSAMLSAGKISPAKLLEAHNEEE